MVARTIMVIEAKFLKIRAFLSFQIFQATSKSKLESPFRLPTTPPTPAREHHHSWADAKSVQREVSIRTRPSHSFMIFQTRIEYQHLNIMCTSVSGLHLQNWQRPQFGQPRRVSLSIIHTRSWRINQAKKNLHFGGAQLSLIGGFMKELVGV
jgi:hypothetical protein